MADMLKRFLNDLGQACSISGLCGGDMRLLGSPLATCCSRSWDLSYALPPFSSFCCWPVRHGTEWDIGRAVWRDPQCMVSQQSRVPLQRDAAGRLMAGQPKVRQGIAHSMVWGGCPSVQCREGSTVHAHCVWRVCLGMHSIQPVRPVAPAVCGLAGAAHGACGTWLLTSWTALTQEDKFHKANVGILKCLNPIDL